MFGSRQVLAAGQCPKRFDRPKPARHQTASKPTQKRDTKNEKTLSRTPSSLVTNPVGVPYLTMLELSAVWCFFSQVPEHLCLRLNKHRAQLQIRARSLPPSGSGRTGVPFRPEVQDLWDGAGSVCILRAMASNNSSGFQPTSDGLPPKIRLYFDLRTNELSLLMHHVGCLPIAGLSLAMDFSFS